MVPDRVTVRVPATVANLGAGFDVLAAAVGIHTEVTVARTATPSVRVPGPGVPQDTSNLIYRSAEAVGAVVGYCGAFAVEAQLSIPTHSGLGSSAAAIAGGVVAANRLLGERLDDSQILRLAADIEGHPDNVAGALFGGVVVVSRNGEAYHWTRILPSVSLSVVLAVPALEVPTLAARSLLPAQVSREDAVFNLGRATLLVAALAQGREDLLRYALDDRLHQSYRAPLVPGLEQVIAAAGQAGAHGAVLSGSGPTVAALAPPAVAAAVGGAMRQAFADAGVESQVVMTTIEQRGALDG